MHARRLGRTGLAVSEVGYGAWGIGGSMWIGADDDESVRALHRAIDLGLTFVAEGFPGPCVRCWGDRKREVAEQVQRLHAHRWVRDFYA